MWLLAIKTGQSFTDHIGNIEDDSDPGPHAKLRPINLNPNAQVLDQRAAQTQAPEQPSQMLPNSICILQTVLKDCYIAHENVVSQD